MSEFETTLNPELNAAYPLFKPNQLLTSNHLNKLRNYLDTQDRLARIRLIGIGIVCGLEVQRTTNKLIITAGTGITSEGFLVTLNETAYSKCAKNPYQVPDGNYAFFNTEEEQEAAPYEMVELLPDDSEEEAVIPFNTAKGREFLSTKVVLLFVEYQDIELEKCVGENCDDKGTERRFNVRKLLVDCEDAKKIIDAAYTQPMDELVRYNRFEPEFARMKSMLFRTNVTTEDATKKTSGELKSVSDLQIRYKQTFEDLPKFVEKMQTAFRIYSPLFNADEAWIEKLGRLIELKEKILKEKNVPQYFYDYLKDLYTAYNELIADAFEIISVCQPAENKFPRHLFLGKVKVDTGCAEKKCEPPFFRTQFIQTTIYNLQKHKIAKLQNDIKRFAALMADFEVPEKAAIKITPSNEKQSPLALRSIPFYYKPDNLYKWWNYEWTVRCKPWMNLGYWASEYAKNHDFSTNPLAYDKDAYNFYRVEGILGKTITEAKKQIYTNRRDYNLDFKMIEIKLNFDHQKGDWSNYLNDDRLAALQDDYLQLRNEILLEIDKYDTLLSWILHVLFNSLAVRKDELPRSEIFNFDEINNLRTALPKCISDFDLSTFRTAYKALTEFVFFVVLFYENFMATFTPAQAILIKHMFERVLVRYGFMGNFYDLYDILRSTLDAQMISLYFSYGSRIKQLQNPYVLSNFVAKNPGVEHQAGVPKGGTLVLVTDQQKGDERPIVVADFAASSSVCCDLSPAPLCPDADLVYPPIARNVYKIYERNPDVLYQQVNVIEASVDLNVLPLKLAAKKAIPSHSKAGAALSIIDPTDLLPNFKLVNYEVPSLAPFDYDEFSYTIENSSGKTDSACVFIGAVGRRTVKPNQLHNNEASDGAFANPDYFDKKVDEPSEKTVWAVGLYNLAEPQMHVNRVNEKENTAADLTETTKEIYIRLDKGDELPETTTPANRTNYENHVLSELKGVMKNTADSIKSIDLQVGEEPKNIKDRIKHRITFADKFATRDALVTLYENQTATVVNAVQKEGLATTKTSKMYQFIDNDLRKGLSTISKHVPQPEKKLVNLEKEVTNNTTKKLLKSFNKKG